MKTNLFVLVMALGLVSGCAWGDRHLTLPYTASSSVQNKNNIVIKIVPFSDKRAQKDTVGYSRNGYGMRCAKVIPDNSVSQWVTDALKAELTNAGYTVVTDKENSSNVISGAVYEVFCDTYMTYEGRVNLLVDLEKDGNKVLNKNYLANKSGGITLANTSESYAKTLQLTLQEVLRQVLADVQHELNK